MAWHHQGKTLCTVGGPRDAATVREFPLGFAGGFLRGRKFGSLTKFFLKKDRSKALVLLGLAVLVGSDASYPQNQRPDRTNSGVRRGGGRRRRLILLVSLTVPSNLLLESRCAVPRSGLYRTVTTRQHEKQIEWTTSVVAGSAQCPKVPHYCLGMATYIIPIELNSLHSFISKILLKRVMG